MKRFFTLLFALCLWSGWVTAQVVVPNPFFVTEETPVIITFHADRGSRGLMDFTGDVYAHTGVITSKSTGDSDWKYVVSNWGVNVEKAKLTRVAANTYQLTIPTDIRTYYNVPADEKILKMALVFRSATQVGNQWLEGKDDGGRDIFIDVYEEELTALLASPVSGALVLPGDDINITGYAMLGSEMKLFLNGELIAESNALSISHTISAPSAGSHVIRLEVYDGTQTKFDEISFFIREMVQVQERPVGVRLGVNHTSETSVTLVLQAPFKEFVYALGDFNDWEPRPGSQMKKDGEFFWLTIDNLEPGREYVYQYYIDGQLRLADPYTSKVLDPWNDRYIPDRIYPNLIAYPFDKTSGLASVFKAAPAAYQWRVSDFKPAANEDLVIYEVLIRDFTANGDIKTITDTLDYFVRLGVNAIELMPFNEFEGNDSWGYNPSFYFATDKAYGTANDYKAFIDACHERGIAVIMDMVLNHSFSQSPLLQMYFEGGKAAANNPWYNRDNNIKNPNLQWGFPFNHESVYTHALIDSIMSYWIHEYKIDGFRFDFTKGFTNKEYPASSWASEYDASRIAILKRMVDQIRTYKDDAIIIFEHLADNSEEKVLADYGILMWGNMNHSFSEAVMGYHESNKSDFSWASYKRRNWNEPNLIAYMESHDEERIMFRALNWGVETPEYSVRNLNDALKRKQAATAFLFTIPGPKMIWQFGELGFDISIDNGGRLGKKPPKWDYLQDPDRVQLLNLYTNMIQLKTTEPAFATDDYVMEVGGAVKFMALNHEDNDVRLIGNFDTQGRSFAPRFSRTGWWYNHFRGDSVFVSNLNSQIGLAPGEFVMYSSKKMKGFQAASSTDERPEARLTAVLHPVPVGSLLSVSATSGIQTIQIFDVNGREVIYQTGDGLAAVNIQTGHLPKGVYMLKLKMVSGVIERHKFIK